MGEWFPRVSASCLSASENSPTAPPLNGEIGVSDRSFNIHGLFFYLGIQSNAAIRESEAQGTVINPRVACGSNASAEIDLESPRSSAASPYYGAPDPRQPQRPSSTYICMALSYFKKHGADLCPSGLQLRVPLVAQKARLKDALYLQGWFWGTGCSSARGGALLLVPRNNVVWCRVVSGCTLEAGGWKLQYLDCAGRSKVSRSSRT